MALQTTSHVRFHLVLVLTCFRLPKLLLEHCPWEWAESLEHLDFAIAEFRDMKMQLSLERALRHNEGCITSGKHYKEGLNAFILGYIKPKN